MTCVLIHISIFSQKRSHTFTAFFTKSLPGVTNQCTEQPFNQAVFSMGQCISNPVTNDLGFPGWIRYNFQAGSTTTVEGQGYSDAACTSTQGALSVFSLGACTPVQVVSQYGVRVTANTDISTTTVAAAATTTTVAAAATTTTTTVAAATTTVPAATTAPASGRYIVRAYDFANCIGAPLNSVTANSGACFVNPFGIAFGFASYTPGSVPGLVQGGPFGDPSCTVAVRPAVEFPLGLCLPVAEIGKSFRVDLETTVVPIIPVPSSETCDNMCNSRTVQVISSPSVSLVNITNGATQSTFVLVDLELEGGGTFFSVSSVGASCSISSAGRSRAQCTLPTFAARAVASIVFRVADVITTTYFPSTSDCSGFSFVQTTTTGACNANAFNVAFGWVQNLPLNSTHIIGAPFVDNQCTVQNPVVPPTTVTLGSCTAVPQLPLSYRAVSQPGPRSTLRITVGGCPRSSALSI